MTTPDQPPGPYGEQPYPGPPYPGAYPGQQPAQPYPQQPYLQQPPYPPYPQQPPYLQHPQHPQHPYAPAPRPFPRNNLAVWSLVLGLVGIVLCGVTGIPSLIMGVSARRAVTRGEADNPGLALAGVVLGGFATAWGLYLFVFGAIPGAIEGWNA